MNRPQASRADRPGDTGRTSRAARWAGRWTERCWALEDCRHLSRGLEADLVRAGETVVRVPPKLMAEARRSSREPGDEPEARSLDRYHVLAALETRLAELSGVVARIAADLVVRIRDLTRTIEGLEREIARLVAQLAPTLLALQGCGPLTAAKLVGEVAGIDRFRSAAAFARYDGTAPVPVWSGNQTRHRLNRGGNRQLNVALHRIAITQLQRPGKGQDYLAKRMAGGDTKTEAIRLLRRRISDEVYRRMRLDAASDVGRQEPVAMAA